VVDQARNQVIDIYRGALIFSVLVFHFFVFWAPPFVATNTYGYNSAYPAVLGIGRFGVHVFFVISGLVISMTVLRSKGGLDFAWRRFSRLFPAMVVCCTMTYIFTKLLPVPGFNFSLRDYFASFTLMPERLSASFVDGSYWSLGVEVRFYIWVVIFTFILGKNFWKGFVVLGLLAILQEISGLSFTNYYLIGANIHFFLFGISFWYFIYDRKPVPAWLTLICGSIIYAMRYKAYSVPGGYVELTNLIILGSIVLLFISIHYRMGRSRYLAPFAYMGAISYPLYLIHQTIGVTIIHSLKSRTAISDGMAASCALVVVVVLAIVTHHFVELPAQVWLRKTYERGVLRLSVVKNRSGSNKVPGVYGVAEPLALAGESEELEGK
jgi:peptidoglycan/LPS O-acetylase OafA/YrhL